MQVALIKKPEIFLPIALSLLISGIAFGGQYLYLLAIPVAILLGVIVFLKPDVLFFSLGFLTPLSINPHDAELGKLSLALPTEPMAALLVVLFFYVLLTTDRIDPRLLKHPISILIYIYFFWLLVTTATSVDKVVSIKFVIAKMWFIIPGYFLAATYFREPKNLFRYLMLFVAGMFVLSCYNIIHLAQYSFEDKPSQSTMQPFFKDHTILGAVSAMVLPLCFGLFRLSKSDVVKRMFFFSAMVILIIGTIITYSRAAWASIVPALLLLLVFVFHIRFKWVFTAMLLVMAYLFMNIEGIITEMERNKVAGGDDLEQNIESISNISSDPSNLERINRWACALEMWNDKPVFGFGPGTYMFEYAPYQLGRNYTSISTNFGDIGNAHSEYLGPLAETGMIGMLIFMSLFVMCMYYAMRAFLANKDKSHRVMICTLACGLVTYFTHGFLNNFLDTDKASFIFWPMIAAIVVYDLAPHPRPLSTGVEKGVE
ncbi:MAG: O-antigen ligase family protein [Saprospiraceae bacterium]|nr:O-antigen ligase family protein [Saprospiraceae bacterium]